MTSLTTPTNRHHAANLLLEVQLLAGQLARDILINKGPFNTSPWVPNSVDAMKAKLDYVLESLER